MGKCSELLAAIDEKEVKKHVLTPCRLAESSYRIKNLFPKNSYELQDESARYWNHLGKHFYNSNYELPFDQAISEAGRYIGQAFRGMGGMQYAVEKAKTETFGYIKSIITNSFIEEKRENFVMHQLRRLINPYSYEERKTVIEEYIKIFDIKLENEGDLQTMIAHYEVILISHAEHHGKLEMDRLIGAKTRG